MLDLIGSKFGWLTVTHFSHRIYKVPASRGTRLFWICRCECGNTVTVSATHLRSGHTNSCGCFQKQRATEAKTVHGDCGRQGKHPIYETWRGMMDRCYRSSCESYKYYGAKGVRVCRRWRSYINFKADMLGTWQAGLTLNRRDNDGSYTPANCHWATQIEQSFNRSNNRWIEWQGQRRTITQWAAYLQIHHTVIHGRLKRGWSIEKALFTPVKLSRQHK